MMDITFTYIPEPNFVTDNYANLGQLSLASILKNNGINSTIINFNELYYYSKIPKFTDNFEKNIVFMGDYLLKDCPKIISFYTMCSNILISLLVAEYIKKKEKSTILLFAGPHASLVAKDLIQSFNYIDGIALGEGENVVVNNVLNILNNNFQNCKNFCYKKNQEIIYNWECRDRVDPEMISSKNYEFMYDYLDSDKVLSIEGGRGCPFSCTFCTTKLFWGRKFVLRNVKDIVDDIEYYYKKFGCKFFEISHDLFTLNKEKLKDFCNLVQTRNLHIAWSCSSRLDVIEALDIEYMAKAGCSAIFFGIESGSHKIQKKINKNITFDNLENIVKAALKNNVKLTCSFIYGFPEENFEDITESISMICFLKKLELKYKSNSEEKIEIQFNRLAFLAGSELAEQNYNNLEFDRLETMDYVNTYVEISEKTKEIILNNKRIFLHCFNLKKNNSEFMRILGFFINIFFNIFYTRFNQEIESLIKLFNSDFLSLFSKIYEKGYMKVICDYYYLNVNLDESIKIDFIKKLFIQCIMEFNEN